MIDGVQCPECGNTEICKHGRTIENKQRYRCRNADCSRSTFIDNYSYRGHLSEVKAHVINLSVSGKSIRVIASALHISPATVVETLKSTNLTD